MPALLLQAFVIFPKPLGPQHAQHRENNKTALVEGGGGGKVQVDQVHDGPGHATAKAFYAGQQLAQAQRWAGIEGICGQ